jgi:hypothetical protein
MMGNSIFQIGNDVKKMNHETDGKRLLERGLARMNRGVPKRELHVKD